MRWRVVLFVCALSAGFVARLPTGLTQHRPTRHPHTPSDAGPGLTDASAPLIAPAQLTAARAAFDRGVEALEGSRFADAALAFEESYRLNPVPVVQFNLAYAYRGLGRVRHAIEQIERFLAAPGNTPADRVLAAQSELVALRAALVRVRATIVPANAQLTIDGQIVALTGAELVVDPGPHVVEVTADGYHRERREVQWPAQTQTDLNVTLTVIDIAPRLRVEPSVASAIVMVDGRVLGRGLQEQQVTSGPHEVRINAEGYVSFQRTIVVGRSGLHRVDAMLTQRRNSSPWPWLAPTIAVVGTGAVVGVTLAVIFSQPGLIPNPTNQWDAPVR